MPNESLNQRSKIQGTAVITIHFQNRIQWQKYRLYVLKTEWEFDGGDYPYVGQLPIKFACIDDVEHILKKVIELLQLGFDVYSCQWKLESKTAEETSPIMTE